jgi:hypothetical protein
MTALAETADRQSLWSSTDRLDGRPAQMVEDSRPDSEPITRIVHEIVHVTQTPEEIAAEGEEPLLLERRGVRQLAAIEASNVQVWNFANRHAIPSTGSLPLSFPHS